MARNVGQIVGAHALAGHVGVVIHHAKAKEWQYEVAVEICDLVVSSSCVVQVMMLVFQFIFGSWA